MPAEPHRDAPRHALPRPAGEGSRRRARDPARRVRREEAGVGRPPRQRRGDPAGARPPRRAAGHGHRPDVRARSRLRLSAGRLDRRALEGRAGRSGAARGARGGGQAVDRRPCRSDARVPAAGHADVRLRQQHPAGRARRGRGRRVRVSGLRARVHPAAVLRRQGAVPLGRAVGRSRGHLQDRPQGGGALSRQRASAALARDGAGTHRVPGAAGAHLLARAWASVISPASRSTRW